MKSIEVVAAIIFNDNKILATRRGYGDYINMWEFPGGKIESGETKEDALRREIREELDVEITIHKYITTVEYDYPNFHLTMHCYSCTILTGTIKLSAHNEARWLSSSDLTSVEWLPADIDLIHLLQKELE
jgi:8-oxo-dGTP diphosphatase